VENSEVIVSQKFPLDPITDKDLQPAGAGFLMSGNYPSVDNAKATTSTVNFAQKVNVSIYLNYALKKGATISLQSPLANYT
jgi:uncharacterized glyoxalase superfamily protein PhnB